MSIFGAWMTTTPLTAKQLHVEQIEIYVLFGLFLAALITSGAIAIRLLRFRNAQRRSQITSIYSALLTLPAGGEEKSSGSASIRVARHPLNTSFLS